VPIPSLIGEHGEVDPDVPDPYALAGSRLSMISSEMLECLYSVGNSALITRTWSDVRRSIALFCGRLERWKIDLPDFLNFGKAQADQAFLHQRYDLAIRYHHVTMLTNRPCLCLIEARNHEASAALKEFSRSAAVACVQDAHRIINLLTESLGTHPINAVRIGPWWCLLHYAVSAAAVTLLELAFRGVHFGEACNSGADQMFMDACAIIRWIDVVSDHGNNEGARRCAVELSSLLRSLAPKIGRQYNGPDATFRDIFTQHPQERDVSAGDEHASLNEDVLQHFFPGMEFLHEPGSSGYDPTTR